VHKLASQIGGVLEPRVALGEITELAGQLDQRLRQIQLRSPARDDGRSLGRISDSDTRTLTRARFNS
jgi:hypothetical protein